jgi:hypothetical protein
MIVIGVGSLASVLALMAGLWPLLQTARARRTAIAFNERVRAIDDAAAVARSRRETGAASGAAILVRIAAAHGANHQRTVNSEAAELLAPNERIRLGVQPGIHSFLLVVSLDDHGTVSVLYPDGGSSMPMARGSGMQLLPGDLELTGTGVERLVVLLSDDPLQEEFVRAAAAAAFQKSAGNLQKLPQLALPGEQFHRTFIKAS